MKSSLGLAGKAYSSGKIAIESDASAASGKLIAEEKDISKLKVSAFLLFLTDFATLPGVKSFQRCCHSCA